MLICMGNCEDPSSGNCIFDCGLDIISHNEPFQTYMQCMVDNDCVPDYEPDGLCLATDDQALQDLIDVKTIEGDWWVLKGKKVITLCSSAIVSWS